MLTFRLCEAARSFRDGETTDREFRSAFIMAIRNCKKADLAIIAIHIAAQQPVNEVRQ